MKDNLIATASVTIEAPVEHVWDALVNPERIREYMFGAEVVSDWKEGSPIRWKGEWQGSTYEDKGTILSIQPGLHLVYSHFSPLSGLEDVPENYHTVSIGLTEKPGHVVITLTQDNNPTEEAREHSEANWNQMLRAMKVSVEKGLPGKISH